MNIVLKDKLKAFGIHLVISFVIAVICFVLINLIWYPSPLFKATGVQHIFLLMLGIDLVLGPLFTFIVYKKGKKTLKMDLIVIAVIQISAIVYGLYTMYQGRPVWISYVVDRFELVRANEVVDEDNVKYSLPKFGQEYRFADISHVHSEAEQFDLLFSESIGQISPSARPKYHKAFELAKPSIQQKTKPLIELNSYNNIDKVKKTLAKYPNASSYLPLKASDLDMTVLINQQTGEVVKIVDLRPWK